MNYSSPFQQLAQEQAQQIPFDRLIYNFANQLPSGQGMSFSTNMSQIAQQVVEGLIGEIQGKVSVSAPRTYLFNLAAANGYNNPFFIEMVNEFQRHCEIVITVTQQHPLSALPEAILAYVTYKASLVGLNNPMLVQRLPHLVQSMRENVQAYEVTINQMNQRLAGGFNNQQQRPATIPYQPNAFVNQNAGVAVQNSLFTNTGPAASVSAPMNLGIAPAAPARPIEPPQPQPSLIATPFFGNAQPAAPITPLQTAPAVATLTPAATQTSQAPVARDATAPIQLVAVRDADTSIWVASERWPAMPTYDPNKEELKFHIYNDGSIQPVIAQKAANMDRAQHLAPIAITPNWVLISQTQSSLAPPGAIAEVPTKPPTAADIKEIGYPDGVEIVTGHKENWVYAEAHMLSQRRKYPDASLLVVKQAFVVDTLIASSEVYSLINFLLQASSHREAAALLENASKVALQSKAYLDYRSIVQLVTRLTQRVNRFVALEMSLNFGRIDSYIEDAPQLGSFLTAKLGKAAGDLFESAYKRIISESVSLAAGPLFESIQDPNFQHCVIPPEENLSLMHLYNYTVYGVIDASTLELRAEIPAEKFSVLISESSTPLLYNVAWRLLSTLMPEGKNFQGVQRDRFLLRTNDGVTIEITQAAFNPKELVAGLYNND